MLKQIHLTALAQQQREEAKDRLANNLGCTREQFDEIQSSVNRNFGVEDTCVIKRLEKLADPDHYLLNP